MIVDFKFIMQRQKERIAVCNVCEFKIQGLVYEKCVKQSCKCSLLGLTTLAESKCPENKWKI